MPVIIDTQDFLYGSDFSLFADCTPFLPAAQYQRVLTFLMPEAFKCTGAGSYRCGLEHHNIAVKDILFICRINHLICKCPQEIAFPELYHLNRSVLIAGVFLINGIHTLPSLSSMYLRAMTAFSGVVFSSVA